MRSTVKARAALSHRPRHPAAQAYLDDVADYRTNQYEVPADLQLEITTRCRDFMCRYGYGNDC